MNTNQNVLSSVPTPESIWAILQETARLQKENERDLKAKFAEIAQLQKVITPKNYLCRQGKTKVGKTSLTQYNKQIFLSF